MLERVSITPTISIRSITPSIGIGWGVVALVRIILLTKENRHIWYKLGQHIHIMQDLSWFVIIKQVMCFRILLFHGKGDEKKKINIYQSMRNFFYPMLSHLSLYVNFYLYILNYRHFDATGYNIILFVMPYKNLLWCHPSVHNMKTLLHIHHILQTWRNK